MATAKRESYSPTTSVSIDIPSLAPNYEKLAKLYTDNSDFASKVVIAKIDATANDVPDEIAGFPTIKLYPAGAKESPIEYSGSRTIEDLANFVRDSGKYKIDAWVAEDDTVMEDASAGAGQETMAKAAPAATVSEEVEGVKEKVKSKISEAAQAAKTVVGDSDEDLGEHDEL